MTWRFPSRRRGLAVALLAAVMAGCSDDIDELPAPPPTSSTTATTAGTDYSAIGLPGVPGTTTTAPPVLGPGRASLSGSVTGPDGPVEGAQVLVERLVGDAIAQAPLVSDGSGRWDLRNVLGGRYRVRAFVPPELTQVQPTLLFLEATESQEVVLRLERFSGLGVEFAMAPTPPEINERVSVVVQVTRRSVDETGVARSEPLVDARLELFGSDDWEIQSENPVTTDSRGEGDFVLRCRDEGRHALAVVVGTREAISLGVPACVRLRPPPSTTTTAPPRGAQRPEN